MRTNSSKNTDTIIKEILEFHAEYFNDIRKIDDALHDNLQLLIVFENYFLGKLFADGYVNFSDMIKFGDGPNTLKMLSQSCSTIPSINRELKKRTKNLKSTPNGYHNQILFVADAIHECGKILEENAEKLKYHTFTPLEEYLLLSTIFSGISSIKVKENLIFALILELIVSTYDIVERLSSNYDLELFTDVDWRDMFDSPIDFLEKFLFVAGNEKFLGVPNIELIPISAVSDLINGLPKIHINELFFRGQSDMGWFLVSSINRSRKTYQLESFLYNQMLISCPSDFESCKLHLDYLVKMQHYGIPTRLLDITSNPLVALFFACNGVKDKSGEIIVLRASMQARKYDKSDTITLLSSLPLFTYKEQQELLAAASANLPIQDFNKEKIVQRFLQEIKTEKPAFREEIIAIDLKANLIVTPAMKNNRILKQSGAFIITGLVNHNLRNQNYALNQMRYRIGSRQPIFIVLKDKKVSLLNELDRVNINEASLFPEIQEVSKYLVNKYTV